MENRYKAIITTKNIYEEVDLSPELEKITIGTSKNSAVRFSKRLFFDDFEITLYRTEEGWRAQCAEDLYFLAGGIMKLSSKDLTHGDELIFKTQNGSEVLRLAYTINFDYFQKNYDCVIDVSGLSELTIGGGSGRTIKVWDEGVGSDFFALKACAEGFKLTHVSGKYGVYINGLRAKEGDVLSDYDFISIAGRSFYYKDDTLHTDPENLDAGTLHAAVKKESESDLKYPEFQRSSRIKRLVPEEKIKILPPEHKQEKPKNNLLTSLLPMATMAGVMIAMGATTQNNAGTYMLYSMCSMGAGGLVGAITYGRSKKEWKEKSEQREQKYLDYIDRKEKDISEAQNKEQKIRNEVFASPKECIAKINRFDSSLFSKNPNDDDFLTLCLGSSSLEAKCRPEADMGEYISLEDPLFELPEKTAEKYKYVDGVPVTAELKKMSAMGIEGEREDLYDYTRGLTADLSANHFYTELKLFFIGEDENYKDNFGWVKWSPHIVNDDLDRYNLGFDEESRSELYEYLYAVLKYRMENGIKSVSEKNPQFVIFVYNPELLAEHPLFKSLDEAKEYGFAFIFADSHKDRLPAGCGAIVTVNGDNTGSVVLTDDASSLTDFTFETVGEEETALALRKLAGVRIKSPGDDKDIKSNLSLFEAFKAYGAADIDLGYSWNGSKAYLSLAAPLGVAPSGELFMMDIHEKAMGPHGLIAGTTGSGKSELLQSYLLSLAATYHPHDLAFVIIDFKGDALARQFKSLPHLMGSVTNLAGKDIERFLLSIKAENARRERLFAEADVKNADDYMKLYKSGKAEVPVPHLVIVVDEFAELKQNYPEFMNELVSVARVGRSLGVHLILATQKPAGLVSEQIESNTRFRICLKVGTEQDSMEVLKSPLAAEITEPGRAYIKVGNNELFQKFQSAYSGGPAVMENDGSTFREYSVSSVDFNGMPTEVFSSVKLLKNMRRDMSGGEERKETQAKALIDHIASFAERHNISSPGMICLPPLGKTVPYSAGEREKDKLSVEAEIGITDKPEKQAQPRLKINFTKENTLVIGSARYGKTYLLKTAIRDLAQNYSPDEVNIYIIDFNSKILKTFEKLNHVGGVVTDTEDEKLKNLIKMLDAEIDLRKELLAREGVTSFEAYKAAGGSLPQIVLMIDNLTALKEGYFEDEDPLSKITREGLSAGISVIIANSQTQAVGYRNMANFSNRIAFTLNDANEYFSLFDRCRKKPEEIPGRCIVEEDREIYEAQIFGAFSGETEIEQTKAAKIFIEAANKKYSGMSAREIPVIPEILRESELKYYLRGQSKSGHIPVGLDYASVEPVILDITKIGAIGVFGREQSGKTNFIKGIIRAADREKNSEIYIIDDYRKKLGELKSLEIVKAYSLDPEDAKEIIAGVHERLMQRLKAIAADEKTKDTAHLMLVFNTPDVLETIAADMSANAAYKEITGRYKNLGISVIISNVPNAQIGYSAPDPLKSLKEPLNFIAFEDMKNIRAFDVPFGTQRLYKKPLDVGDAYLIQGDKITKMKTALEGV